VADPVSTYLHPALGQWSTISEEAGRWRAAAADVEEANNQLTASLGRLDAGWEGANSDAFVAYLGRITAADTDVKDAFIVMAGALDDLAAALREVVSDMANLLRDTAEVTSESVALSTYSQDRVRGQLRQARDSAKNLFETVRDLLRGFVRFCGTVDGGNPQTRGIGIAHRYPSEKLVLNNGNSEGLYHLADVPKDASAVGTPVAAETSDMTTVPAASDSTTANDPGKDNLAQGNTTGSMPGDALGVNAAQSPSAVPGTDPSTSAAPTSGAMPMGMMPPMMGAMQGGGDIQRKSSKRRPAEPEELFGDDNQQVAPPVIGRD
jgi:uncharacterized protein YukE